MKTQDNFQNYISRTTFRTISTTSLGIRTPSSSRQVVHNRRKIQGKRIKTNVAIAISHEPSGKKYQIATHQADVKKTLPTLLVFAAVQERSGGLSISQSHRSESRTSFQRRLSWKWRVWKWVQRTRGVSVSLSRQHRPQAKRSISLSVLPLKQQAAVGRLRPLSLLRYWLWGPSTTSLVVDSRLRRSAEFSRRRPQSPRSQRLLRKHSPARWGRLRCSNYCSPSGSLSWPAGRQNRTQSVRAWPQQCGSLRRCLFSRRVWLLAARRLDGNGASAASACRRRNWPTSVPLRRPGVDWQRRRISRSRKKRTRTTPRHSPERRPRRLHRRYFSAASRGTLRILAAAKEVFVLALSRPGSAWRVGGRCWPGSWRQVRSRRPWSCSQVEPSPGVSSETRSGCSERFVYPSAPFANSPAIWAPCLPPTTCPAFLRPALRLAAALSRDRSLVSRPTGYRRHSTLPAFCEAGNNRARQTAFRRTPRWTAWLAATTTRPLLTFRRGHCPSEVACEEAHRWEQRNVVCQLGPAVFEAAFQVHLQKQRQHWTSQ